MVDAEVETRSTRSPDETALDEDAMEERPVPKLPWRRWWSRMKSPSLFLPGAKLVGNERPARSAARPKIHLGTFSDKTSTDPVICMYA